MSRLKGVCYIVEQSKLKGRQITYQYILADWGIVKHEKVSTATMCRWITFISTEDVLLSDLVLKPSNSLIDQSIDASYHPGFASRFNHTVNADGFGVRDDMLPMQIVLVFAGVVPGCFSCCSTRRNSLCILSLTPIGLTLPDHLFICQ